MGFLSQLANVFTGSESAKAATQAGEVQEEAAINAAGRVGDTGALAAANLGIAGQQAKDTINNAGVKAQDRISGASTTAAGRFDQFGDLGSRGIDLSSILGNPQGQAEFLKSNPLFQLGLDNANEQTMKGAASRGRLTSGDTLEQLNKNAMLVGQPLINNQRADIMNLLGIGQNTAGTQASFDVNTANELNRIGLNTAGRDADIGLNTAANVENTNIGTTQDVANLLTGGSAARAAGIVGAQNARTSGMGNIIDVAGMAIGGIPPGTFTSNTPTAVAPNAVTNQQFISNQNQPGSGFTGFGG